MEAKEYQNLAMRTNDGKGTDRLLDWTNVDANGKIKDPGGLLNGCLGLSGEAGELNDLVKKWIFHKKPLDREHMKKEIGDVCWYIADICHSMGFDLGEIFQMNIDKLKARYQEGFSEQRANNRSEGDI
jgi:NTP pyrophosphatase (non-canonical NTP hydrolase)